MDTRSADQERKGSTCLGGHLHESIDAALVCDLRAGRRSAPFLGWFMSRYRKTLKDLSRS